VQVNWKAGLLKGSRVLLSALLASASSAALSPDDVASQLQTYLYRPHVFADLYLGSGVPRAADFRHARLWYFRLDRTAHSVAGIETLAQTFRSTQTPGLDFTNDPYLSDGEFLRLIEPPGLEHLRLLRFPETRLGDMVLPAIGHLLELEVLTLNTKTTDQGVAFLKALHKLKSLSLEGAGVTNRSASLIASLKSLERLRLRGTSMDDDAMASLATLHLRQLDLGTQATDKSVISASRIPTLQQLDLSLTSVSGRGLQALSQAQGIHTLFLGKSITDEDLKALPLFKNLKRLDLSGARITDQASAVFAQLQDLEELALTDTGAGPAVLAVVRKLPHLRYLEISGAPIPLEALRTGGGFSVLKVLSLSSTRRLKMEDIRFAAAWPALHGLLINGVLLGPDVMDYLRQKSAAAWTWFVAIAEAAEVTAPQIEHTLDVANADVHEGPHPFSKQQGLARIHAAETSLEDVSVASPHTIKDPFEESEKGFIGEFTINANPAGKQHS